MTAALHASSLPLPLVRRGKVREVYDAGPDALLLVASDRISAFDVVMILKRGREAVTDCVVEVDADRAETDPKVFTNIKLHYIVTGTKLDPNKVERAIKLSEEKYCSASAMLGATAKITHDFEVREASA